jgi:hypothetical protein
VAGHYRLGWDEQEATAGFEPAIGVLQTLALPLGYVAPLTDSTSPYFTTSRAGVKIPLST